MKKEVIADLHIHSKYSPAAMYRGYACRSEIRDILKFAKKRGLSAVAITDHDRIAGCLEALKLGKKMGITVVPGIEVTSAQ
ncbi:PHP domain-containing protein, partial [Nanoarchaeota archaeon]